MKSKKLLFSPFIKKKIKKTTLDILRKNSNNISEFDLIKKLQEDGCMEEFSFRDTQKMFENHFLLYHCLYELRDDLLFNKEGVINITSISINLEKYFPADQSITEKDQLADYYKNIANIKDGDASTLTNLLDQFWDKYDKSDKLTWALKILDLPLEATANDVRKRYRCLAKIHHPDRGSKDGRFKEINRAMNILKEFL